MSLELLANELLLDLFEYFHSVPLLHAFHGLNSRFDALLFVHFQHHYLDLRSISKHGFDFVCRQHLPSIVDRITSLRLSEDDDTPNQGELFLSRGMTFRQFTHLRSLALHQIRSDRIVSRMASECHLLFHLTRLNLTICHDMWFNARQCLIDKIWNLPKLTHFHFGFLLDLSDTFPIPTKTSSTLQCLSIEGIPFDVNELAFLFQQTPCLRRLHVHLRDAYDDQDLPFTLSSLTVLKVIITDSLQTLMNLLQNTPNLCYLTVETDTIQPDGNQWTQIITDYLPKLKVLRLKMEFEISDNREQVVDELLYSFRSRFWLDKHRWFVRCHWYSPGISKKMCLYTLPYAFREFICGPGILSKSTCPDNDYWSFDRVHNLYYSPLCKEHLNSSNFRFSNLRQLYLTYPFDENISSTFPKLDRLISLCVCASIGDDAEAKVQILLKRLPNLCTLQYDSFPPMNAQVPAIMHFNVAVRRLDLQKYDHWFDEQQCNQLGRSPLSICCEVLRINVKSRTSILDLVKKMTKLRALNVHCLEEDYVDTIYSLELVKWLQHRLPPVFVIRRDTYQTKTIRLWLR